MHNKLVSGFSSLYKNIRLSGFEQSGCSTVDGEGIYPSPNTTKTRGVQIRFSDFKLKSKFLSKFILRACIHSINQVPRANNVANNRLRR